MTTVRDMTLDGYDGVEIDMLSLGDADSVLVTGWKDGQPTRVLIDGGRTASYPEVRSFMHEHDIKYIDHLVCSHPHDDHAGGLVKLVEDPEFDFGQAWLHDPSSHTEISAVASTVEKAATSTWFTDRVGIGHKFVESVSTFTKSVSTAIDLAAALDKRGVSTTEPFAGDRIAFLDVCGPAEEYYCETVGRFSTLAQARKAAESELLREAEEADDKLEEDPQDTPENNSSTILAFKYSGGLYVLTADAGVPALSRAADAYDLGACRWMQIPHHGSKQNINRAMIDLFSPKRAWVSAEGNQKHPRRVVVQAFKDRGAKVYSTHYPFAGAMHCHRGSAKKRYDGSLVALWDAD